MTDQAAGSRLAIEPHQRLIVALDVPSPSEAWDIVEQLRVRVGAFKIGLQLFTAAGPDIVKRLVNAGIDVFLDLKFHDIPNTVAMACVSAARLGVWMMNVHAAGGSEMMIRAREAVSETCHREGIRRPLMIAVTVLTSSDRAVLQEIGVDRSIDEQVGCLADLTSAAGLDGVVASAHEIERIRTLNPGREMIIVTPGIRTFAATNDDQKRVMTFGKAIAAGADYVVAGRPVIEANDRAAAVGSLLAS